MIKLKIMVGLFLTFTLLLGFDPKKITEKIEHILYDKKASRFIYRISGVFGKDGSLWLSWNECDNKIPYEEWMARTKKGERIPPQYTYWYIQKFDSLGEPFFPAVELAKRKPGGGISAPIYCGNWGDIYSFPGFSFRIERIDNKGNRYTSKNSYKYMVRNMFIDSNGIMYVYSTMRGLIKLITKFKIQEPLPNLIAEQQLPNKFDEEKYGSYYINYPYNWLGSNLIYCSNDNQAIACWLPPFDGENLPEKQEIKTYNINLPNLMVIDTSSFRVDDALFKKIKGCKLRSKELTSRGWEPRWINVSTLLEGEGDTLILFLSSRGSDEDVIYVCKLTKDGKPIKSAKIIEEEVKGFDKAPEKLCKKIIFRGGVTGNTGEPTGIMIYGFDKTGNVYYYLWDKSDDYWRER